MSFANRVTSFSKFHYGKSMEHRSFYFILFLFLISACYIRISESRDLSAKQKCARKSIWSFVYGRKTNRIFSIFFLILEAQVRCDTCSICTFLWRSKHSIKSSVVFPRREIWGDGRKQGLYEFMMNNSLN